MGNSRLAFPAERYTDFRSGEISFRPRCEKKRWNATLRFARFLPSPFFLSLSYSFIFSPLLSPAFFFLFPLSLSFSRNDRSRLTDSGAHFARRTGLVTKEPRLHTRKHLPRTFATQPRPFVDPRPPRFHFSLSRASSSRRYALIRASRRRGRASALAGNYFASLSIVYNTHTQSDKYTDRGTHTYPCMGRL